SPYSRAKARPSTCTGVESCSGATLGNSTGSGSLSCAEVVMRRRAWGSACRSVQRVDVRFLRHACCLGAGAFVQVDRVLVPQQRAALALLRFQVGLLGLEFFQEQIGR